jgi:hypothetical protein
LWRVLTKKASSIGTGLRYFLVGQGGVEPPTLGFSLDNLKQAIPHHF